MASKKASKNIPPHALGIMMSRVDTWQGIRLDIAPKGMDKEDKIFSKSFKDMAACNAFLKSEQTKILWPKEECSFYKERE